MKKMIFVTVSTFDPAVHAAGEINRQPSLTVPDQVFSLHELLARYARGQSVEQYVPVSDEDLGFEAPDLRSLDLTEVQELKEATIARIKEIRDGMRKAKIPAKVAAENPAKQQELRDESQTVLVDNPES